MALLLDYPGTDTVDLVIMSQGQRYRLEMPIITTCYCPELDARVSELLGVQNVITVHGPA